MDEKIKDLKSKLKYLVKKGKDIATICKELDLNDYEVYGIVELMKQELFEKIEQRRERLELFEKKIEEIPVNDRYRMESYKIEIYS